MSIPTWDAASSVLRSTAMLVVFFTIVAPVAVALLVLTNTQLEQTRLVVTLPIFFLRFIWNARDMIKYFVTNATQYLPLKTECNTADICNFFKSWQGFHTLRFYGFLDPFKVCLIMRRRVSYVRSVVLLILSVTYCQGKARTKFYSFGVRALTT